MTRKLSLITVVAGSALVLAAPAWGKGEAPALSPDVFERTVAAKLALQSSPLVIVRDHGDAEAAKLAVQSSPLVIVRDHGDATQAKLAVQSSPLVIVRDHGDATQAKLAAAQSSPLVIVRDHGDATQAKLAAQSSPEVSSREVSTGSGWEIGWPQLGIGFGAGMFFLLGLILTVRFTRSQRLAH